MGKIISNGKQYSGGSALHNYSSEEQLVGFWFDKPRYEKTYQVTAPSNNQSTNLIDITDLNIDTLVSLEGTVKNITTDSVSATATGGDFILWVRHNYNDTGVDYIATTVNYSGYHGQTMYVTIQYTKSTD